MKHRYLISLGLLLVLGAARTLASFPGNTAAAGAPGFARRSASAAKARSLTREQLLKRLAAGEPASPPLFAPLTNLLLDYVDTILSAPKQAELYSAENRPDFMRRLKSISGKDILDLGNDLFGFYEKKLPKGADGPWSRIPAGPFLLHVRPGSPADQDRELISRDAAETASRIAAALDLSPAFDKSRELLAPVESGSAGLIPIYLHPSREGKDAEKIRKQSYGSTTFGATIVEGQGRTTCRSDILYMNALSLAVLEHEIAHAVVILSSFDPTELAARELRGESELRKAFMAGYRQVPSLLMEGLGDWAFYYHGFHKAWGLLPAPGDMVKALREEGKALPLKDILSKSAAVRGPSAKASSLEAASFLDFLLKSRGKDAVKRWLFAGPDAARTFNSAFGLSIEAAEKAWLGRRE